MMMMMYVELTDFAVLCAVGFVTKRESKFMKCSYAVFEL